MEITLGLKPGIVTGISAKHKKEEEIVSCFVFELEKISLNLDIEFRYEIIFSNKVQNICA